MKSSQLYHSNHTCRAMASAGRCNKLWPEFPRNPCLDPPSQTPPTLFKKSKKPPQWVCACVDPFVLSSKYYGTTFDLYRMRCLIFSGCTYHEMAFRGGLWRRQTLVSIAKPWQAHIKLPGYYLEEAPVSRVLPVVAIAFSATNGTD